MSQKSSSSLKNKQNVKISSAVPTRESTMNSSRFNGLSGPIASRMGLLSRSTSNMVVDSMEKIQSYRPTLRLDTKSIYYDKLRVISSLQYFRDDWGGVTAIRYFQDVEKMAVGFNSGDLQVCTASAQTKMKYVPTETILKGWEGNDSISCIRFHPKKPSILYASSTAGTVMRRDLEESANYNDFFISEDNEIFCMDFTSKGELVTVGRDATVRVYDVSGEKLINEYGQRRRFSCKASLGSSRDESCHEKRIYCVRCHPSEPSLFVSGGWDGIRIWDTRLQRACVRRIVGPFIFGEAVDISNGMLLTASYAASSSLQLWDLGSGLPISDINPTNKRVYLYGEYPCVAQFFDGDTAGDLVLYGVGGLQLISIKELSILYLFEDEKPVGAVDSKGSKVAFGGKSNSVLHGKIFSSDSGTSTTSCSYASILTSSVQSTSQKSGDNDS